MDATSDWQCGSSSPMTPIKRHDREERQMLHGQEEYCLHSFIFIEAITGPLNSIIVRDDYTHMLVNVGGVVL